MSLTKPATGQGAFIVRMALCAAILAVLGGCVSTSRTNFTSSPAPAASGDPLVLNTTPAPGSKATTASATADVTPAVPADDSTTAAVAPPSLEPAAKTVDSAPLAPAPPSTSVSVAQPPPTPTPETVTSNFPNINTVPAQPEGKLLSPEERAKMIAQLEALRKRQQGAAPAAAALPAKCLDKKVAKTDPDCKTGN